MAAGKKPAPWCSHGNPENIEDRTLLRGRAALPGPVGTSPFDIASSRQSFGNSDRSTYLTAACMRASVIFPGAVLEETGYPLDDLPGSLVRRMRQMLLSAGTPAFGAEITVVTSSGRALLGCFSLSFLMEWMGDELEEVSAKFQSGIQRARNAAEPSGFERWHETDRAAEEIARSAGILIRLVLEAIVLYLKDSAAAKVTVRTESGEAANAEAAATLADRLRAVELTDFAVWLERRWRVLLANPSLQRTGNTGAVSDTSEKDAASRDQAGRNGSQPEQKTWVAIQLIDQDGQPVPNERYHIVLPDGSVKEGSLNSAGEVSFDEIDPGQCEISFPDLDGREWKAA